MYTLTSPDAAAERPLHSLRRTQAAAIRLIILPAAAVFHLETAAKLLKLLERVLAVFSKCALKSLDNQADFDSAIPWFESRRPSQPLPPLVDMSDS